jgi:hypothetical protein
MAKDESRQGRERSHLSRAQAAFYSGLVGGAVGMAVGTRLRRVFGRHGAAGMFAGTPCSALPAEGGGDPVASDADTESRPAEDAEGRS